MTRIFGKKQVLLATLIVALGVAVYLNYYFSSQQPPTTDVNGRPTSSTSSRNMGDASLWVIPAWYPRRNPPWTPTIISCRRG